MLAHPLIRKRADVLLSMSSWVTWEGEKNRHQKAPHCLTKQHTCLFVVVLVLVLVLLKQIDSTQNHATQTRGSYYSLASKGGRAHGTVGN